MIESPLWICHWFRQAYAHCLVNHEGRTFQEAIVCINEVKKSIFEEPSIFLECDVERLEKEQLYTARCDACSEIEAIKNAT